jgi:YVTN family beta-propeller protein
MNCIKSTLATLMRLLPPRGEEGWVAHRPVMALVVVLVGLVGLGVAAQKKATGASKAKAKTSNHHSTTIALTSDELRLVVVNREANSLSIIQVKDAQGNDVAVKLDEIAVGLEPRCVAVHPNGQVAYVTNGISGTVSAVDLVLGKVAKEVSVGTEPRGCALTPTGNLLYVANHTEGTVSIIVTTNPLNPIVNGAVQVGRNPTAIAITNDGDNDDTDETVFVTQIFAELDPTFVDPFDLGGEVRDLGKRGVVHAFPAGNANPPITKITLSPLSDSGFTATRSNFCPSTHPAHIADQVYCPDPTKPATDPVNANNPQGVFPNQLLSALIRGNRLYLPNIGAQPEPPEVFNVNVQALVYAVDTNALAEVKAEHVNLNQQIAVETAAPPPSLDRTFANDIVAIDANLAGDTFLIVSRGGNQVFRAKLDQTSGQLNILNAAGTTVDCRIQTGNLPSGVAMRRDGTRGYANNEANFSVTSMNIDDGICLTLQLDIPSSEPPAPGSLEHAVLVGKLAFFTALGIPDNDIFGTPIRQFVPRNFKGKMSKDAWSSCGSCHPDGLADGVTWSFGTGPRQTKPLDGMFNKGTPDDKALLNWSGVRGSNTDFNANSRATQGGCGFASDDFDPGQCFDKGNTTIANPAIYDHGITQGGSEALDAQTFWIFFAVRPLNQPQPSNVDAGALVFEANCASCHGGAKWTKSQIFHRDNPAAVAQNGPALDPGVDRMLNEFRAFTCGDRVFKYLEDVGTFDVDNPLEIRDNAAASTAFGADGFNPPSLLSINYHAPYLHRGQAQTLEEVFPLHGLGAGASGFPPTTTIATELSSSEQADLLVFLKSIDGTTAHFRSEGDEFRDALRLEGTCPGPTSINEQLAATEKSSSTDPTPVAGGPAGTFTVAEEFCNVGPNELTLLKSVTTTLTGGNILLNRDGGTPAGVGSVLTFPAIEGFGDRVLGPNECVTVTYKIGLASTAQFQFLVDVQGDIVEPLVTPSTVATASTIRGP